MTRVKKLMAKKQAAKVSASPPVEVVPLPDCDSYEHVVSCAVDEEEIEITTMEHVMEVSTLQVLPSCEKSNIKSCVRHHSCTNLAPHSGSVSDGASAAHPASK